MIFSDSIFLFIFFPVVLVIYFLLRKRIFVKNIFLFLVSLFFYGWGNPQFVMVMIYSILLNYIAGLAVHTLQGRKFPQKIVMCIVVVMNLAVLFHYKYQNFALNNLNSLFGTSFKLMDIVLPIGISFFTFQAMSYVIDVYRGKVNVQKNPVYLGLYISFFPQLIAGPIVRYETIEKQICNRTEDIDKFSKGMCRFVVGLGKKVLLANNLAIAADFAFQNLPGGGYSSSVASVWLGAIAYTLQIYFDFSGYSDMAIGLGQVFGFEFEENFNYPYISSSITDFWRRWHISLSTWFRDYVYIPLGGNRCTKSRQIYNLVVVWLLTGIWHGANWTYISWGLFYFFLLVAEKLWIKPEQFKKASVKSAYAVFTLVAVVFAWVLFRSQNIGDAMSYWGKMVGIGVSGFYDGTTVMLVKEFGIFFLCAIAACIPLKTMIKIKNAVMQKVLSCVAVAAYVVILLISTIYIINGTYNPFIYFNF